MGPVQASEQGCRPPFLRPSPRATGGSFLPRILLQTQQFKHWSGNLFALMDVSKGYTTGHHLRVQSARVVTYRRLHTEHLHIHGRQQAEITQIMGEKWRVRVDKHRLTARRPNAELATRHGEDGLLTWKGG